MSAPKAVVIAVPAPDKSPISRRPQEAHLRRPRPSAGHPVVALRSIAPISGRPQIAIAGAVRLRIFRQRWRGLCGLHHWLAVAPILVASIVIVSGIVLVWRRLLIVLLRRLVCWLLLIVGTGRLGRVRRGQVGRSCWILRLVGLRRLTLAACVLRGVFLASYNSKRQCDGHDCQKHKRRCFVDLAHKGCSPRDQDTGFPGRLPPHGDAARRLPSVRLCRC